MRTRFQLVTGMVLVVFLAAGGTAVAQTRPLTEAECKGLRERLADHARLSDGARRALAAQAAAFPAPPRPVPPAAPVPAPSRAEAIRARLAQIPEENRRLQDERTGAMVRFEFGRAAQLQGQIQALDTERANLERELAALPAGATGTPPAAPATPQAPAAPQPVSDADRIPCQDLPAAYDNAVKTRQRELGAREGQAGAIPLLALKSQRADQIAQELAGQFAAWPQAATQVGLLDQDGDGRLDGFVDAPAPNIFRLYRQRSDGTLGIDVFALPAPGGATGYDEMARRLEEATIRQTRRTLPDLLATHPAGPVRVLGEAGDFGKAQAFLLAGNVADAARIEGGGTRMVEFQNLRGEPVRLLEAIAPTASGLSVRRLVVLPRPNNEEQWEETAMLLRPTSIWRLDAEVTVNTERRAAAGTVPGSRATNGPLRFGVDR